MALRALGGDEYFAGSGFQTPPDLPRRLSLFGHEYGVPDKAQAAWALHQSKQRSVEAARYWPIALAEGAAVLRLVTSELEWLHDNLEHLLSKLD